MGDIVTLVENAAAAIDEADAKRMEERLRRAEFDFNDFLEQFKMMRRMGPLEKILGMLPGMDKVAGQIDEKQLKRTEAIVLSMTIEERTKPDILNARRRQRIARGSGHTVTEVNELITRFNEMRKMMKQMPRMQKMLSRNKGKLPFGRG
jgi:signal recognition particle subunit SRP54